jgi:mono/diheme cytochrome c family protein
VPEPGSSPMVDGEALEGRAQCTSAVAEPGPQCGEALFRQRCAKCHDAGVPGIPTKQNMAKFPKDYLIDVLTKGLMMDQAIGLSDSEIDALAAYVSEEGR